MGKLIILIPFSVRAQSDLLANALELKHFFDAPTTQKKIGENVGATIDAIEIKFLDDPCTCYDDDYVIVFAHGSNKDTKLYDNQGHSTTMAKTIEKLVDMDADETRKVLFMVCFSALPGHIAPVWKARETHQAVYGGSAVIANLYSSTKSQIYSICKALSEVALVESEVTE